MSETYEIYAIKYGEVKERYRRDNLLMVDDHASLMPIDFYIWVLRNDQRTILVDTGFDQKEAASRGRAVIAEPRDVLKHLDIDADAIDTAIISHLHFDHAGLRVGRVAPQHHGADLAGLIRVFGILQHTVN
ncbi:MAG: MBL fold metallo-hydrolase, partial [Pseudomonadota bacterium]